MTDRQAVMLTVGIVLVGLGLGLLPSGLGLVALGIGGVLGQSALIAFAIGLPPQPHLEVHTRERVRDRQTYKEE